MYFYNLPNSGNGIALKVTLFTEAATIQQYWY